MSEEVGFQSSNGEMIDTVVNTTKPRCDSHPSTTCNAHELEHPAAAAKHKGNERTRLCDELGGGKRTHTMVYGHVQTAVEATRTLCVCVCLSVEVFFSSAHLAKLRLATHTRL